MTWKRKPPPLVFYGASGHAATIRDGTPALSGTHPLFTVVAYIDDFKGDVGESLDGAPVISFETWRASQPQPPIFVAVGNPQARRSLVERTTAVGGSFASLYRPGGAIGRNVVVGDGSVIMVYASVGAGTTIGRHVQVMPLATIDGECTIGDFATICPSSTLYGRIAVENAVFVGAGARIVNETPEVLTIGADAFVAAGAVVRSSVAAGAKVIGNPAREMRSLRVAQRER